MNYIVTSICEKDFSKFGISWLSSLFDYTNYDGEIIFIDEGLSEFTKSKLLKNGIIVLDKIGNFVITSLKNFVLDNKGVYAYWDSSCIFQKDIKEVFDLCDNKILYTRENGFYAFDSKYLNLVESLFELCSFLKTDPKDFFEYYKESLLLDNKWNFKEVFKLNNIQGNLCFEGELQNILNYSNEYQNLIGKNLLFWEKNKECYEFYLNKFKKIKV
jgi:hypothetical protein